MPRSDVGRGFVFQGVMSHFSLRRSGQAPLYGIPLSRIDDWLRERLPESPACLSEFANGGQAKRRLILPRSHPAIAGTRQETNRSQSAPPEIGGNDNLRSSELTAG